MVHRDDLLARAETWATCKQRSQEAKLRANRWRKQRREKKVVKSKCKHEARSWPRRKGPDSAMKEKEIEKAMERRRRRRRSRKEQPDNEWLHEKLLIFVFW